MKTRHNNWSILAVVAIVVPMAVNVTDSDSTYNTTITLAGGAGSHGAGLDVLLGRSAGYGCDGTPESYEERGLVDLEERFRDIGGGIDHQLGDSPWHIGIRGGYVWEDAALLGAVAPDPITYEPVDLTPVMQSTQTSSWWDANPYLSLEARTIGIGLGLVRSQVPLGTNERTRVPEDLNDGQASQPSFHLRLGVREKFYVSYHLWEGIPIYSGGGMHNFGVGFVAARKIEMWTGYASGGPYQSDAMLVRATLGATSPVALNLSLRLPVDYRSEAGGSEMQEIGGSVGLVFRR